MNENTNIIRAELIVDQLYGDIKDRIIRGALKPDDFFFRYGGAIRAGKHILWSDPLINLLFPGYDLEAGSRYLENSLAVFEKYADHKDIEYLKAVFRACLDKCALHTNLRSKYQEDDRVWLKDFADHRIPEIIADFEKLQQLHYKCWHADYKTHGFERLMYRYCGAIGRLKYTAEVIIRYLSGEISQIEELEPEVLHAGLYRGLKARDFMYITAH